MKEIIISILISRKVFLRNGRNIAIVTICFLFFSGCYVPFGWKLNNENVGSIGRAKSVMIAEQILRNNQKICIGCATNL